MRKVTEAGGTKTFLKGTDFFKDLTKTYFEAMLEEEMSEHLGHDKYSADGYNGSNSRDGTTTKKIRGDFGEVEIETPRDRESEFYPQIIGKRESNVGNFSEKIISLYARGMTTREIEEHLHEMYSIEVSAQFISRATARIQDEITEWQNRPLEKIYPVVYIDGLWVSVRSGDNKGAVIKKCVCVVLGLNLNGMPDVLGLWVAETEGAKFWLKIFDELKTRGVQDIFILCGDGLKGLSTAQEAAFPKPTSSYASSIKLGMFSDMCRINTKNYSVPTCALFTQLPPWKLPNSLLKNLKILGVKNIQRLSAHGKIIGIF